MTSKEIKALRPLFKYGTFTMLDWFEITEAGSFCLIRSGLRHANPDMKSPFFYENSIVGENSLKESIVKFNEWWNKNTNVFISGRSVKFKISNRWHYGVIDCVNEDSCEVSYDTKKTFQKFKKDECSLNYFGNVNKSNIVILW